MEIKDFYCSFVNMDHRHDRLAHMEQQLQRIGLPAVRTRGMKHNEVIERKLATPNDVATMFRRTQGAIGCHFSQVQVMRDALEKDKHALVMEDDLVFCEDFNERLEYIFKWTETHEWDVIWLGASFHVPPYWHCVGGSRDMRNNCSSGKGHDCEVTDDPRMIRTWGAFCTFAYLVNKNSMPKIFELFDENIQFSIGIDWLFIKIQPQLKCFSFVPGCVKQMDSQSDIGDGVTRWSGFLQLNGSRENSAYVYQEKMTDFNPNTFQWK